MVPGAVVVLFSVSNLCVGVCCVEAIVSLAVVGGELLCGEVGCEEDDGWWLRWSERSLVRNDRTMGLKDWIGRGCVMRYCDTTKFWVGL